MSTFKDQDIVLTKAGIQPAKTLKEQIEALSIDNELKSELITAAHNWQKKMIKRDPDAPPLETENGAALLAADIPPAKWAIPDLLPEGITMLGGKPKLGKSWLVLQIALAICSGGKVFGRDVELGKVLYLALEDNKRRLKSRMKLQGWDTESAANFDYMLNEQFKQEIGNLDEDGAGKLAQQIAFKGYSLVIIDTFGRAFVHSNKLKDQNAYHQISQAMDEIQKAAMENSAAVMFVDHHTKGTSSETITPDAIADIQGSISKGGMSDCAWGIYKTRTRKDALLQIDGRDIEEVVSLAVYFDRLTASWQSEGGYYQKKLSDRKQAIVEWLYSEGPMTASQIAKLVEMKLPNVMSYLNSLIQDTLITKDEDKIYHLASNDYAHSV